MKLATAFSEEFAPEPPAFDTIDGMPALRLPGDGRLLSEFAAELGELLEIHGIFNRRGAAFTLDEEGQRLKLAEPGWLRTWVETHVVPFREVHGRDGKVIKIVKTMAKESADAVLVSPQFDLPSKKRGGAFLLIGFMALGGFVVQRGFIAEGRV